MNKYLRIERRPETLSKMGISKGTLYNRTKEGLFPPALSLGSRAVGYYAHETQAILAAIGAEKTKEEMKKLVSELVQQRKKLL